MSAQNPTSNDDRAFTYLVGVGVTHSIAPPMHDTVAKLLGYDWKFIARECSTVEDAVELFRKPTFAGGVVTMPYKVAIMQHLDGLDHYATLLKACNNVYRTADGSLVGTNTDWRGIKGCLQTATQSGTCLEGRMKPAVLVGAGGAARAALYVLHHELQCKPIFVVNRDKGEVEALSRDAQVYESSADGQAQIIHLETVASAADAVHSYGHPFYVVGTVPDFEPQTKEEVEATHILEYFLQSAPVDAGAPNAVKGVLLDMCFKPRRTRAIKLAEKHGWVTVEGTGIIGHQIEEQYRLWCGDGRPDATTPVTDEIKTAAWDSLGKAADKSTAINF